MDSIIQTIHSLNQRGGRMLSIVDLLEAKTLTLDQAGFFVERMATVPSILSGAVPGGAGKTTLLGALLGLLPREATIMTMESGRDVRNLLGRKPGPHELALVHEISPGHYYSYLWADEIKVLFQLIKAGHRIAATLHADNPGHVYAQVGGPPNSVPEEQIQLVDLMVFIQAKGGWMTREHKLRGAYKAGRGGHQQIKQFTGSSATKEVLQELTAKGIRTIEEVRQAMVYER